jgi:hypothetical protein
MSAGVIWSITSGGRVAQHAFGADVEDLDDAAGVGGDAREIGAVRNRALQGARLQQSRFGLLARGNIAQDAGEVTLTTQPHFAGRNLQRKEAAILAPADHLASPPDGARGIARQVIFQGCLLLTSGQLGYQHAEVLPDEVGCAVAEHLLGGRVDGLDDAAMGMQGDDAVDHGIENRGHQRGRCHARLAAPRSPR